MTEQSFLTESYDLAQRAVARFVELIDDLAEHLGDETIRRAVLTDLGLNPETGVSFRPPQQNMDSIRSYISRTDVDAVAFAAVVEDVSKVVESLRSFVELCAFAGEAVPEDLVREIVFELLVLTSLTTGRYRSPAYFALAEMLGIINYELDSYGMPSFAWDQIKKILRGLRDLVDAFRLDDLIGKPLDGTPLEQESNARDLSDAVLLLSAFALFSTIGGNEKSKDVGLSSALLYGWDIIDPSAPTRADRISDRVLSVRINGDIQGPGSVKTHVDQGLAVAFVPAVDGGPGVFLALGTGAETTIPLSKRLSLEIKPKLDTEASFLLHFGDLSASQWFGPSDAGVQIALKRKDKYVKRLASLPDVAGTHFSLGAAELKGEISTQKVDLQIVFKDNVLVISGKSADSFIRKSLPGEAIQINFDLGVGWNITKGSVYFTEGTRLKMVLPIGEEVLGVRVVYVTLDVTPAAGEVAEGVQMEISGSLAIQWGPFTSSIDRMGLLLRLPPPRKENGDGRDWAQFIDFKPPIGVGLGFECGSVTGSGFLFYDRDNQEYAGAIQLSTPRVDLKLIGLITTRLPEGGDAFCILVIGSVEFSPGVSLGFFTLDAVGVLVGINRSMVLDTLRTGVRSGTLDSILFAKDPVKNAPKIINDLRSVFPPTQDRHVFGALLRISWAGLKNAFSLKLGVVLEVPSPIKLVLLGQLEMYLPSQKSGVVLIQCDVVGTYDQAASLLTVDAALRDSRVGRFPLTGNLAVRANWGNGQDRGFILAAGGVHPGFTPPASLPPMDRLQIALGTGDNPRLRLMGYLAITSNTIQVGARAELHASASGFTLDGWAGIDALFEFSPFKIKVDFSAGVEIRRGSRVLFSLTLKATLDAFTPFKLDGKVKFSICFISFTIPFHVLLGDEEEAVLPPADVQSELVAALQAEQNWSGGLPGNRQMLVTLRAAPPAAGLTIHPLGTLSVRQQVAPLEVDLELYKSAPISGTKRFSITGLELNGKTVDTEVVEDDFAPGQYFALSDDEKLSRPSFEPMAAGVAVVGGQIAYGTEIASELSYETILVDRSDGRRVRLTDYVLRASILAALAEFGSATSAPEYVAAGGCYRAPKVAVKVEKRGYTLTHKSDLVGVVSGIQAGTYTEAAQALRTYLAAHPEEKDDVQIVGLHERVLA